MNKEVSFGVIPLKKTEQGTRVLMVQHRKGHWGFPKGHPNEDEDVRQTARRELFEEVGLTIFDWILDASFTETYHFDKQGEEVEKMVVYFPSYVEGEVILQVEELSAFEWLAPEDLALRASFPEMKLLCHDIAHWLRK